MKVALLLSGQFRNGKECYQSIYENLLKHYDVDVFIAYMYEEPELSFDILFITSMTIVYWRNLI
jgi:hypothetical protein